MPAHLWLLLSPIAAAHASVACGRRTEELLPSGASVPQRVKSPLPSLAAVPADGVDWRWRNGTAFTTPVGYQLLPSPCGSCWAFASTGALSDRVRIATAGRVPVSLAPQALLDCGGKAGSCNGGSATLAYEYATQAPGLPDETCMPYKGVDHANWGEVPCADRLCRRCDRFGTCHFLPRNETPSVQVEEHGVVTGVAAMKAEIAARGPIACYMYAHAPAFEHYAGGVISDTTRYKGITHVVVVVGWGKDAANGEYWIVRNSFGTAWGEWGYYRQQVGKNIYNMESHDCAWATPTRASVDALMKRSGLAQQ